MEAFILYSEYIGVLRRYHVHFHITIDLLPDRGETIEPEIIMLI